MSTIFQGWQNQNRYRKYPFSEDANLATVEDPDILLPDSLVVDLAVSVPVLVNEPGLVSSKSVTVLLAAVMYSEPRLVLFFSLESGEQLATAIVSDLSAHTPGMAYDIYGTGDYSDVRGTVVLGDLDELRDKVPAGSYTFKGAVLEPSAVRPTLNGVRSVRIGTGTALSDPLYGIVKLLEGSNVKLTYIKDENAIRIDAVRSDGFVDECRCEEAAQAAVQVKMINGLSATNLNILGDDCVRVETKGNTITIRDKCSFPCCGCEEMEFIMTRLKFLETAIQKVEAFATTLSTVVPTSVNAMKLVSGTGGTMSTTQIRV